MNKKLFVSSVVLNPKSSTVQSDLSDLYSLHRRLIKAFHVYACKEKVSMLYRIGLPMDQTIVGIPILVQSMVKPIWDELLDLPDYFFTRPTINEIERIEIQNDSTYYFKINAGPSRLSADHKVVRLYHDQLLRWIVNKGILHGFYVEKDEISIKKLPTMTAIKVKNNEKSVLKIDLIEYTGSLHVVNKTLLTDALFNGIGRGTEFGCGLISLAS